MIRFDRKDRVHKEIENGFSSIRENIKWDEDKGSWLLFKNFILPKKIGIIPCNLLLMIPETYPNIPPSGFFLDCKIHDLEASSYEYASQQLLDELNDIPILQEKNWYWFDISIDYASWQPNIDPTEPDNLITFMSLIDLCLKESC